MNGILYVVPTPIGNLEDITLRAVRILQQCDIVVCEDTRQTIKLLSHLKISKYLISFYTQNQLKRIPQIISLLNEGKNIALVSDCGTPAISDPGYYLIKEALNKNLTVVPLPGACALITALVGSGLTTDSFIFLGFLRKKLGKMRKELELAKQTDKTIIFYESPHRILKTLEVCKDVFGDNTDIVLARELTKKFEEFIRGQICDVIKDLSNRQILGEFVVVISNERENLIK
ncbi:16S rRNA (cytidine(1402)-2'-O)-methyltransferase [Candidatus Ruminimicrobium bovinum]|uniref:16S rRNA (cytidine(1402)-2'-O)-methyltransferase n=1 Tax=Candidatus Ruminimicrobium bovinum TaxID=3242779 RepID=UPI0039B972E8